MKGPVYRVLRELHLCFGLFISPFVLVFAVSVFFLVHAWMPGPGPDAANTRVVSGLSLPGELESLSGRALIDALQPVLRQANVQGEVGYVQHKPKEHALVIPVTVPGRVTTVRIDLLKREAAIEQRATGLADALVSLHKSPGPHLAGIRMNWVYMRVWRWLADSTAYLLLFLPASGVYLWCVLRAERKLGIGLLAAGAISFVVIIYALCH